MARQEIEQKIDELAPEYHDTRDPEAPKRFTVSPAAWGDGEGVTRVTHSKTPAAPASLCRSFGNPLAEPRTDELFGRTNHTAPCAAAVCRVSWSVSMLL
jgi:hypothetical protein